MLTIRSQVRDPFTDETWVAEWRPTMIGAPPLRWEKIDGGWKACVYVQSPDSRVDRPDLVRLTLAKVYKNEEGWRIKPFYSWMPKWADTMRIAKTAINAVEKAWRDDDLSGDE